MRTWNLSNPYKDTDKGRHLVLLNEWRTSELRINPSAPFAQVEDEKLIEREYKWILNEKVESEKQVNAISFHEFVRIQKLYQTNCTYLLVLTRTFIRIFITFFWYRTNCSSTKHKVKSKQNKRKRTIKQASKTRANLNSIVEKLELHEQTKPFLLH